MRVNDYFIALFDVITFYRVFQELKIIVVSTLYFT